MYMLLLEDELDEELSELDELLLDVLIDDVLLELTLVLLEDVEELLNDVLLELDEDEELVVYVIVTRTKSMYARDVNTPSLCARITTPKSGSLILTPVHPNQPHVACGGPDLLSVSSDVSQYVPSCTLLPTSDPFSSRSWTKSSLMKLVYWPYRPYST